MHANAVTEHFRWLPPMIETVPPKTSQPTSAAVFKRTSQQVFYPGYIDNFHQVSQASTLHGLQMHYNYNHHNDFSNDKELEDRRRDIRR
jgi:hypothetical protein